MLAKLDANEGMRRFYGITNDQCWGDVKHMFGYESKPASGTTVATVAEAFAASLGAGITDPAVEERAVSEMKRLAQEEEDSEASYR